MHARQLRGGRVVFGHPLRPRAAFRPQAGAHAAAGTRTVGIRPGGARLVRRRWIDGVGSPTGLCRP
ncbi:MULTISPECIES: hypothetical protein [unclassified Kitasatospora]|uniref:hypothetical protein n=1 Tax=unclassified Kitasatospora TaxID=2633591 RepID=UPI00331683B4